MKLIVGLGNPGSVYSGTRHNFGFMIVNELFLNNPFSLWEEKKKFKGEVSFGKINGENIILLEPMTYYNLVGESVRAVKEFYRLDNKDILVIYDEMSLPFCTVRTRSGGSHAGNNGIKNLIAYLGGYDFNRVRVGSGLPPTKDGDTQPICDRRSYVLSRISQADYVKLQALAPIIQQIASDFAAGNFQQTTYKLEDNTIET